MEELRRAGLLTATERRGEPFWSLTAIGREELASAREEGGVGGLPEAPQHRAWRHARVEAAVRIEGFKEELTHAVEAADALINQYRPAMSAEWFELSERLRFTSWRLASAAYCLTEWPEPDDASQDRDENPGPDPGRRGRQGMEPTHREQGESMSKAKAKRNGKKAKVKGGRLGPGELDGLVLTHMRKHKDDGPLTASAIGKGIGRSSAPSPTASRVWRKTNGSARPSANRAPTPSRRRSSDVAAADTASGARAGDGRCSPNRPRHR